MHMFLPILMSNWVMSFSSVVPYIYIGKPDPPANLTIEYTDICSAKVSWSSPFTLEGVPLFYYVIITATHSATNVLSANLTDTLYIFSPMNLNAQYNVGVAAWNGAGISEHITSTINFSEGMYFYIWKSHIVENSALASCLVVCPVCVLFLTCIQLWTPVSAVSDVMGVCGSLTITWM